MRSLTLVVFGLLLCTSSAAAQTDWHFYGGGVLGGQEHTHRAFGGLGLAGSQIYIGWDLHGLWRADEGVDQLGRIDMTIGNVIRLSTGRVDLTPIGIIGFTSKLCDGVFCDNAEDELKATNFGGGFVAAFKGESGRGLHAGVRWTRSYGVSVSFGLVLRTN